MPPVWLNVVIVSRSIVFVVSVPANRFSVDPVEPCIEFVVSVPALMLIVPLSQILVVAVLTAALFWMFSVPVPPAVVVPPPTFRLVFIFHEEFRPSIVAVLCEVEAYAMFA